MPIYEYTCSKGHVFEIMRPMDQRDGSAKCTTCGSAGQRVLSAFAATNGPYVQAAGSSVFRGAAPKPARKASPAKALAAKPTSKKAAGKMATKGAGRRKKK